ncbi:MAG: acetate kinase [Clostridia bacterium]|nr:acetate kinase [Clostridia bacterium]
MKVLVINCGSSSLKYQIIDMKNEEVIAKGKCDKINLDGSFIDYKCPSKSVKFIKEVNMPTHNEAISTLINELTHPEHGAVADINEISAVGHRVVHGGEMFSESVIITDEVLKAVEECNDLAPLHNPANIIGIKACKEILPNVPMVAVFDTAFHQTMPEEAYLYALPYEYYEKYKVRRYGFHGTSHRYVLDKAAQMLNKNVEDINVISCHLGNGASVCAIKGGKSIDTSMGLTPLEGLMMGTRCGDIDPAIIKFIMEHENLSINEMCDTLNKKSGLLGISRTTSDVRDLKGLRDNGDERAALALKMFAYRVKKYIGSYMTALGRVDAITFEGGIGEFNQDIVELIVRDLEPLGIKYDLSKLDVEGQQTYVSTKDSKIPMLIIPTDEELMIARDAVSLIK